MKTKRHFAYAMPMPMSTSLTTRATKERRGNRKGGWTTRERGTNAPILAFVVVVLMMMIIIIMVVVCAMSGNSARERFRMSCGRCVLRDSAQTRRAWCGTTRRCGDLYEVGACGEDLVMDVERCPMVFREALCGRFRGGAMTGALCEAYDVARRTMRFKN